MLTVFRVFVFLNGISLSLFAGWSINELANNAFLQTWLANNSLYAPFGFATGLGLGVGAVVMFLTAFRWPTLEKDPLPNQPIIESVNQPIEDLRPFHNLEVPNQNLPNENLSTFIQAKNDQYKRVEIQYGPSILSKVSERAKRRSPVPESDRQDSDSSGS